LDYYRRAFVVTTYAIFDKEQPKSVKNPGNNTRKQFCSISSTIYLHDSVLLMVDAKPYMIDIFVDCTCFCDVTLV
jgi:hypothetical protein